MASIAERLERMRTRYPDLNRRFAEEGRDWHGIFRHNCKGTLGAARMLLGHVDDVKADGGRIEESELVQKHLDFLEHGLDRIDNYLEKPPTKTVHRKVTYSEISRLLRDELQYYVSSEHPHQVTISPFHSNEPFYLDPRSFMECVGELVKNASTSSMNHRSKEPVRVRLSVEKNKGKPTVLTLLVMDRGQGFDGERPRPKNGLDVIHGVDGVSQIVLAAHRGEMIFRNRPTGGSMIGFRIPQEKRYQPRKTSFFSFVRRLFGRNS